jgi:hypothetical protein
MLTPSEWDVALAPTVHWKEAYATVEREARAYLIDTGMSYNLPLSTVEFVSSLCPHEPLADWEASEIRERAIKRMFRALAALAEHSLKDCCHRGMRVPLGRTRTMIRPWLWHMPLLRADKDVKLCPHCGGQL